MNTLSRVWLTDTRQTLTYTPHTRAGAAMLGMQLMASSVNKVRGIGSEQDQEWGLSLLKDANTSRRKRP